MSKNPAPTYSCVDCRGWFIDENGTKLRERKEGEEPDCEGCVLSFRYDPETMALFRLFWNCFDPFTGGYKHLPRSGGILDQDPLIFQCLEIIRMEVLRSEAAWPKALPSIFGLQV